MSTVVSLEPIPARERGVGAEEVDVILNVRARGLARTNAPVRRALLGAAGGARVHETASLKELEAAAQRIAARGTGAVILAGGDGTCMAGVTALERAFGPDGLPQVAFVPAGTVNTIARNWGWTGTRAAYTERVVRAVVQRQGGFVPRPTLRVRDDSGREAIGFIFGAGLVSRFFELYGASSRQGEARAAGLAARIAAGALFGRGPWGALAQRVLEPRPCALAIDGVVAEPRALSLVAASVLQDLGLHMRLTYRACERLDRFHAVASPSRPRALAAQLPRVLLGRPLPGAIDTDARELRLSFPSVDAYVLDGETFSAREVWITPGPALRVLMPPA